MPASAPRSAVGYLLTGTLVAGLGIGLAAAPPWATLVPPAPRAAAPAAPAPAAPVAPALATVAVVPSATAPRSAPAPATTAPARLHVDAWQRTFRVVPVGLTERRELVPPASVDQVGWWSGGAPPGSAHGAVVLVVHRDSQEAGRGPFAALEDLRRGDRVRLDSRTYVLQRLDVVRKDALPAARLFAQDGAPRLVVVTCGGAYGESSGWDSNVVAQFAPVTDG